MAALNGTNSTASRRSGWMLDERQLVMRIGARIAMTGKMLATRGNALRLQGFDDHCVRASRRPRAFGERAVANHGVGRDS